MNQRDFSSVVWLSRFAVCGLTTPSRCWRAAFDADGSVPLMCPNAAVTKFTRSTTVLEEIQDALLGHPLTSGGSKRLWPIPYPAATTTLDSPVSPSAVAAWV